MLSEFCTRRTTQAVLAKFEKQYGKGMGCLPSEQAGSTKALRDLDIPPGRRGIKMKHRCDLNIGLKGNCI